MSEVVLVTGGSGFIGSHTCLELLDHGYDIVVLDDYSNSSPIALDRVRELSGRQFVAYTGDIRDQPLLNRIFELHRFAAVVHFAAKKAVAESVRIPLDYYSINVTGTVALLEAMMRHDVQRLVFSSSCSIYGDAPGGPLDESAPAMPTNPYARSKWMCEQILMDACYRHDGLSVAALRYFNPIGAHASGLLGEEPLGEPSNLLPYLTQAAARRRPPVTVFGADYDTVDGTGVRDYIHVEDVASGHRAALGRNDIQGFLRLNLGTGVGTSVLQLIRQFEAATGLTVPFTIGPRRPGDVDALVADAGLASEMWGWHSTRTVADACRDAWAFALANPAGYTDRAMAGP
ncbi:MAG: galE [Pseudonocardiales bacterium]|nr:galE [Pseudonocardiales bacterium]